MRSRSFAAQRADKALAGRVHPRSLDGGLQDRGAGGLEDGVEQAVKLEPRSRIRNRKSPDRSFRSRARLRACCTVHGPIGCEVTPPRDIRRVPCSMNTSTYSRLSSTVSTCRRSTARIPAARACRNCRHVGSERRSGGSMRGAGFHKWSTPRPRRRVWLARRGSTGSPITGFPRQPDGDPGDALYGRRPAGRRRVVVSYFRAASLRC